MDQAIDPEGKCAAVVLEVEHDDFREFVQYGLELVVGVPDGIEREPILNLPTNVQGIRLRFRPGKFAQAFIRIPEGVQLFCLQRRRNGLLLTLRQAINVRPPVTARSTV